MTTICKTKTDTKNCRKGKFMKRQYFLKANLNKSDILNKKFHGLQKLQV
jgi:hypothetical protein